MRRLPLLVLLCGAALFGVAGGVASADVGGPAIVSFLNAQRAANGIPAGIAEDPSLSSGCAAHDDYGRVNDVLVHDEDPAKPGYSAAGRTAAQTSVLYAGGGPWTAAVNPFEQAPIHLHQLLAPRLDRMGAAEKQGYGCATTLASRARPAPAAQITYTYPGNGVRDWPVSQVASEGPYTPGQQVGIPAGTRTGPYLYVSFDGPTLDPGATAQATGATLTGPDGAALPVAVADNTTPGLEDYLPPGMEVIPRAALQPQTTYAASVTATVTPSGGGAPVPFSSAWSFTTGGTAAAPVVPVAPDPAPVLVPAPAPAVTPAAVVPPAAAPAAAVRAIARVAGTRARIRGRALTVALRCSAACTLKAGGTLTIGTRRATLKAVTFRRGSAGAITVPIGMSKAVLRRLRAARSARLALTVSARPTVGRASTTLRASLPVALR